MSPPLPRTVKQPQTSYSIYRSFMAAPLQITLQVPGRGGKQKHSTQVPAAETRTTRLEPTSTSHRRAAASLLLYQSKLHGSSITEHIVCAWSRRQARTFSTQVPAAETRTTQLESASSSPHDAAASLLLHQSQLHSGSTIIAGAWWPRQPRPPPTSGLPLKWKPPWSSD